MIVHFASVYFRDFKTGLKLNLFVFTEIMSMTLFYLYLYNW